MKKFNLFVMAALSATGVLTSCSSDDEIDSEPVIMNQTAESASYLSVNIQLADINAGTRAGDVTAAEGEAYEYKLHTATIYIYKPASENATEDEYEMKGQANLIPTSSEDGSGYIQSSSKITAQFEDFEPEETGTYYALVLANRPSSCPDPADYATFGDWKQELWDESAVLEDYAQTGDGAKGIYMANALMTIDKSATHTLTSVLASQFKHTKDDADGEDPVEVYIERSCAKLTVANGTKNYWSEDGAGLSTQNANYAGTIRLLDFGAHNYNNVAFPIHLLQAKTNYGISEVDINKMKEASATYFYNDILGNGSAYTINWSYTPRYNLHTTLLKEDDIQLTIDWSALSASDKIYAWNDKGGNVLECYGVPYDADKAKANADAEGNLNAIYVPENCQEFSAMHKGEATAVVLHGKWTPTNSKPEDGAIICNGKMYTDAEFQEEIKKVCTAAGEAYEGSFNLAKITSRKQANQNEAIELTKSELPEATDTQLATLNKELNTKADGGLLRYDNGDCYYVVYLRHFSDDDQVPLVQPYTVNQLGRYGLVRNHWYELTVNNINLPGTPYIPDITKHDPDDNPTPSTDPENPDDPTNPGGGDDGDDDNDEEVDYTNHYLNVAIQEMSWAKRTNTLKF